MDVSIAGVAGCANSGGPPQADDRPVVYTLSGHNKWDDFAVEYYGKDYRFVEIDRRVHNYVPAIIVQKGVQPAPVYVDGKCVAGEAVVLHVVTNEGAVTSPHTATATSPALANPAAEDVAGRRFTPAKLDGTPISVIQGMHLTFKCP